MSISDIIEKSWNMFVKHWRAFVPYMVLIFLPTVILSILGIADIYLGGYFPSLSGASNIILFLVIIASAIFGFWVSLAIIPTVRNLVQSGTVDHWKDALMASKWHLWPAFYTSLIVALVTLAGTLLFIIPGIIFSGWYMFTLYAIMLDNQKGLAAMRLSKSLVVGRWWAMVGRTVLPTLLFVGVSLLLQFVITLPLLLVPSMVIQDIVNNLVGALFSAAVTPLTAIAAVIVYLNAKETPVQTASAPTAEAQG